MFPDSAATAPKFSSNAEAASFWNRYGLSVMPIVPANKCPAFKFKLWLKDLTPAKIAQAYAKNKFLEVGFVVGDGLIVLDADSPESEKALIAIELEHGVSPKLVVKTKKGCHHYFQLAPSAFAKSDAHSSALFPARLDVKTGNGIIVLPPSTNKEIVVFEAQSTKELSVVGQDFVDAIAKHNGRQAPRPSKSCTAIQTETAENGSGVTKLEALLNHIDSNCGYKDWLTVLMAVFHETGGCDDGLALVDRWSSRGASYKGIQDIESHWRSFKADVANPVTIGSLIQMARDTGADIDLATLCGESFADVGETIVIEHGGHETARNLVAVPAMEPVGKEHKAIRALTNPLAKYSLIDSVDDLKKQMVEEKLILGEIVLSGQATVIYAAPNTGKTLIILWLILQGINGGGIDPDSLYYINMDDNSAGLLAKGQLAHEYKFNLIADGYRGFEAKSFRDAMKSMIENNTAKGITVVIDTLKKFVNTMDKTQSSGFAKVIRQFVLKGGTVVALSHVNKNPGSDGKVKFSGTTDIVDDFDCAYTMSTVSQDAKSGLKVVEFENIKRRGNVAHSAAYGYAFERNVAYNELLLSLQQVNPDELLPMKHAAEQASDAEVIVAIELCISAAINTKMKLAEEVAKRTGVSKRSALKVIEKYAGSDPAQHRWQFKVADRGAQVFELLEHPSTPVSTAVIVQAANS